MSDQTGGDDTDYESAVRRTHITMAVASVMALLVLVTITVAVFGLSLLVELVDDLSRP